MPAFRTTVGGPGGGGSGNANCSCKVTKVKEGQSPNGAEKLISKPLILYAPNLPE